MSGISPADLRILHATRLLGFADVTAVAERAGVPEDEALTSLRDGEARGWTQEVAFAGLGGWSLTEAGRIEGERRLAQERAEADPGDAIGEVYRAFLPLNARLLRACTDWQLKPAPAGRYAPNDHGDRLWDDRVLGELGALSEALTPLAAELTGLLARFGGYDHRFRAALARARRGEHDWVDKVGVDSCHRVWFELHEDLLATLGIERGSETPAGRQG